MESVAREQKAFGESRSPSGLDEFEITGLVRSVDLVAHNRMAAVGEMHSDLVRAPRLGVGAHQRELGAIGRLPAKSALHTEPRARLRPVEVHALPQPYPEWLHCAEPQQRRIHRPLLLRGPAPD